MTDAMPEINRELFQQVYDHILMHPETHDQVSYERVRDTEGYPLSCGTTRCVAGWAFALTYNASVYSEVRNERYPDMDMADIGAELLGLTFEEASELFERIMDNDKALDMVHKYATKGREWKNDDA